ncbi:MAG: hypothetical protein AAF432_14275 [Planctomycetota bacterium]
MAVIVRDTTSGTRYILIGAGFGAYQSKKPNWLLGDLIADTSEGQHAMICVCDFQGTIGWIESHHVIVDQVDGESPDTLL